jgi:hypothetical protein
MCHLIYLTFTVQIKFTYLILTLQILLLPGTPDSENYSLLIIVLPVVCGTVFLLVLITFTIILCAIVRMCVAKRSLEEDINQQPTYAEIGQCRKDTDDIQLELNTSYGHIRHTTSNRTRPSHFI